jgi:cytochrome c oxidase assembly protein subunit 15
MVKSGLVDNPDVSHFRLSLHLTFAFLTFAYTLWVALDDLSRKNQIILPLRKLSANNYYCFVIANNLWWFVAGLDAGFIHNHWPLMSDGQFMHESVVWKKTLGYCD